MAVGSGQPGLWARTVDSGARGPALRQEQLGIRSAGGARALRGQRRHGKHDPFTSHVGSWVAEQGAREAARPCGT